MSHILFTKRNIVKKVGLLVLVMLSFAQVNSTAEDYSKMSANELNEALIIAVKKGSSDETQKLLRAGANGNQKITYDAGMRDWDVDITTTLLEYAVKHGYVDIVKELIVKAKNDDINAALILAAKEGYQDVVRELIQAKPKISAINTALISSAKAGRPNAVKELIKAGANVNHTDEHGCTALIEIIGYSTYKKTEAWKKIRAEAVQDLLKARANVNQADKLRDGDTALIRAIKNHDIDAVQILLKAPGINVNCANNNGDTPLIVALKYIQTTYISGRNDQYDACLNSQKILEILLQAPGINPHHVNKNGDTAIKLLGQISPPFK